MSEQTDPLEGRAFIADKSAWARAHLPDISVWWQSALIEGRILTCQIVNIELLYSTQNEKEFTELEEDLEGLRSVPITPSTLDLAVTAMRGLATKASCYHRIPPQDAIIAAAATEAGVGVLHYDRHYDRLAEVLEFESKWIATAGSL